MSPDLGGSLGGPVFAAGVAGNGPGQCMLDDARDAGFINNLSDSSKLGCTANDISIALGKITRYSVNGAPFADLNTGDRISCVPGDIIKAVTFANVQNSANERYDVGIWINAVPGGSALTGPSPQCTHYNMVVGQPNVSQLDGDQCGDVASGVLVEVPLDTLTLTCPGGGATTVTVNACAAWSNSTTGGNDNVCPKTPPGGAAGFRQGTTPLTTSKCKCNPLALPIDVKGVLRIEKQTLPDAAVQSFTFTPNYNGNTTFGLSDGQTNVSPPLSSGTYTAAETVPSGWSLTGRECHLTGTATAKTFTSITNGVSVDLAPGEDVTCVFTNTKIPTLTVNKVCVPTSDTGKFNLRIDAATAGTGGDASCGGTTGAVLSTIGSHTASETAGTGTNLTNYTSVISGDCAADGTVTLAAGDAKVCTITNTRKPTLTVNKVCAPTTDTGKFNLRIDAATAGTGADASCGGTTGAVVTSIGSHTASETAGTGTNLSNYVSVIGGDCASNGTITLAAGDNKVCTITNTRNATLTVNKVCVPTSDTGKFNLRIDAANAGTGADASCGGTTGAVVVSAASHTVSETAGTGTVLTNYNSVISGDCAADGTVSLSPGDNKVCTITNTRKPTLTVNKVCVPTSDTGKFNLQIDAGTAGTGANASCGGTTGAVIQTIGSHTAGETAGTGTSLTSYTTVIGGDCAADGTVTLAAGDNKTCTITNTRKPGLTVNKVCVPTSDTGAFNLRIDGATAGTGANAACGGTTGLVQSSIGSHTVSETAGTGTDLANYTSVIGGDCAADGTVSLAAGEAKTCTITNTRKPKLTVNKVCVPTSDTGKFNLQIDAATAGTGADASCGGTTGAQFVSIGGHTAGETAGTGTDLTDYITVIGGDCASNGSVTLAAGDNKTCTITNTRKAHLTVNKVCVPTTDGGHFNLRIDGANAGTGANAACGGTTGSVVVSAASHTVSETGASGSVLTDYTSVISGDCAADGTVTLAAGDNKTCTITNTRKPKLTVNKVCVPTSDTGKFNLQIDAANAGTGADASCGGTTGAVFVSIGGHTAGETAGTGTSLTSYTTVIGGDCAADGSVTLAAGDNKTCTITNTRKPGLTVNKVCVPTSDTGAFNLRIDGATAGTGANAACGGTTGLVVSSIGGHTVSETAGTGTDLANYTSVIGGDCAADGTVSLAAGESKTCTITNTRKPTLRVNKVCAPTTDNGKFNLRIDGANAGTGADASCGGTTGVIVSSIGSHTASETAGTGTDLNNYTSVIGGDCAADGTVSLAAGQNKICTITNTRKPTLRVNKVCVPTTDGGKFNLRIDGSNAGTGADASCGGTTGVVLSSIGGHTVSETAGTNTDLTNYVSAISGDCASDGSITLSAGQNAVCTITNSRKAVLIVDKVLVGGGAQLFDFSQTGIANFQLADATTPKKTINLLPGNYTVCELALAVAWDATFTKNGVSVTPTVDGTTGNACYIVALAYGDSTTIVVTNTPPPGGGTRTIGYWKNWSSCAQSNGGQYDKAIAKGTPEATLDFHIQPGSTVYPLGDITALSCIQAVNLLAKNAIDGSKRAGDPIYNMVAQMLGAKLNLDAGAGTCATLTTALAQAQTFLDALNFVGTGSYKSSLSASDQTKVNAWGGIFGSYNEGTLGGGCPTHI